MKARTLFWPMVIIAVGVWLLLANYGVIPWQVQFGRDWPIILILVGMVQIAEGISEVVRKRPARIKTSSGIAIALIGLWVWLWKLGIPNISFEKNWPLILVVVGLFLMTKKRRRSRRVGPAKTSIIDDLEEGRIDVDVAIHRMKGRDK